MAIVYPLASGNWSTTTWYSSGSTYGQPPLPTDDVYADGKTININQNITVLSITTAQRSGGTLGGSFTVSGNNITITANVDTAGSTTLSSTVTGTLNIIGNLTSTLNYSTALSVNGIGGIVNVVGNVTGGGSNAPTHGMTINASNALVNVTGTVTTTNASTSNGISIGSNARCVINGTVIGGGHGNGVPTISVASTSPLALTLNGIAIGSGSAAIRNDSTGGIILNGTCVAGSIGVGIQNNTTGTLTIINNISPSGTSSNYCISNTSSGIINVNANCLGALSTAPSNSYLINNASTGTVNINGNVTQRNMGPSSTIGLINNASTGIINVNGSVGGGSVQNSIGISNASTGTINVTGNITGGTNTTMTPAIYSTTAGIINVSGETVSGLYPALYSTSTTAINRLKGNIKSFNGLLPFVAFKINCDPLSGQTITIQDIGNTDRLFSTSNVSNGAPLPANVRSGIVYGSLNEFTGSTIMATPDNVRKGVLTDNTIGTGQLTAEDFLNAIATGTDPLSIRLQNVSTVQSTGDQISNY